MLTDIRTDRPSYRDARTHLKRTAVTTRSVRRYSYTDAIIKYKLFYLQNALGVIDRLPDTVTTIKADFLGGAIAENNLTGDRTSSSQHPWKVRQIFGVEIDKRRGCLLFGRVLQGVRVA